MAAAFFDVTGFWPDVRLFGSFWILLRFFVQSNFHFFSSKKTHQTTKTHNEKRKHHVSGMNETVLLPASGSNGAPWNFVSAQLPAWCVWIPWNGSVAPFAVETLGSNDEDGWRWMRNDEEWSGCKLKSSILLVFFKWLYILNELEAVCWNLSVPLDCGFKIWFVRRYVRAAMQLCLTEWIIAERSHQPLKFDWKWYRLQSSKYATLSSCCCQQAMPIAKARHATEVCWNWQGIGSVLTWQGSKEQPVRCHRMSM